MRRLLLLPVVLALGCHEDVPGGGAGFGSGADGGDASSGGAAEPGPGEMGTGSHDSHASGGAEESGSTGFDPVDATTSGEPTSDGASSTSAAEDTGDSSTGDETEGDSEDVPVDLDPCGYPLDGPWIEIEYDQAGGSATSPSWSFSNTPGWGEAQWAASNASWPEVWDLYQNINVSSDPIGVLAVVGSSARLQLMLGFEELIDYDSATVCVEGRSVSTSASVQFEAYNPLTGVGNGGTMAHDWSMHATGLDLGHCFEVGGGVQAVRLDATGGSASLGVKRMRLILHGAVY
ncbi:MAG: hypothetical protein ACE37F_13490 [Nannocystaceae bacterium]|nr:hypothetical protein [bacterium]